MRKYENIDVIAALGAVVELNTEHYKSDFRYDVERLKKAARNTDGENNRFLWLSRQSGTYCFRERDVYIKDTAAYNYWHGSAKLLGSPDFYRPVIVDDRILAYAVNITGIVNGKVKGDLYELDYRDHIRQLEKNAQPLYTVTVGYEDGTILTLHHQDYEIKRERISHRHGDVKSYQSNPEDENVLCNVLKQIREKRESESRPAAFKVRVQHPKQLSIKQQIATGKKQLEQQRTAVPKRTAAKSKNIGMED